MQAYLDQLSTTKDAKLIPESVTAILASKACRGAVMFGEKLSDSEATDLIEALGKTDLYFQCAHGRPTATVIADLQPIRTFYAVRASTAGQTVQTAQELKILKQKLLSDLNFSNTTGAV